ncbi:glycerate kinase [Sulfobacillus harzensis]|uniref:Glycerate kinase n=1 Tax=Sulfobacillus harzensis TaxID=2729629 RepID=A0A7Y0L325_9FIRM|nr:glycerate kinase [Sulfobacillus harzensis]NMP20949.1 glycerate kinase [Sulfobacillus harzensis]
MIAPDRFHPTMKALAVAQAMARGLQPVFPHDELLMYPWSSGGAGTTDLAVRYGKGRVRHERLVLPTGRPRDVKWAWLPDGTVIFDAKDALGAPDGPNPLRHTYHDSYPLGAMIRSLLRYQPRQMVIALGDVLTADGGHGLLQAFGVQPLDDKGDALAKGIRPLLHLEEVRFDDMDPPAIPIVALTDEMVSWNDRVKREDFRLDLIYGGLLDASHRFGDLLAEHIAMPLRGLPGTGVGGGLGIALAFLGSQFRPGAEYLAELASMTEIMWQVDWVMTGGAMLSEGGLNGAVGMMARMARDAGVPAVALTLEMRTGYAALYGAGLSGIYSVLDRPRSLKEAQRSLPSLIEKAAWRIGMWMQAMSDPS